MRFFQKSKLLTISVFAGIVVIIAIVFMMNNKPSDEEANLSIGEDLIILKNEITSEAKFYPYNTDNTYMEVIAVRATDGTVRTALNTCQVCYNSGRGYYEQQGDVLICQNCGNQFTVDQVEIVKGGCNPVPILTVDKIEDEEKIVISGDSFVKYEPLFAKWKR